MPKYTREDLVAGNKKDGTKIGKEGVELSNGAIGGFVLINGVPMWRFVGRGGVSKKAPSKSKCDPGSRLNPQTKRCRKICPRGTRRGGKNKKCRKVCKKDQIRENGRCVKWKSYDNWEAEMKGKKMKEGLKAARVEAMKQAKKLRGGRTKRTHIRFED